MTKNHESRKALCEALRLLWVLIDSSISLMSANLRHSQSFHQPRKLPACYDNLINSEDQEDLLDIIYDSATTLFEV